MTTRCAWGLVLAGLIGCGGATAAPPPLLASAAAANTGLTIRVPAHARVTFSGLEEYKPQIDAALVNGVITNLVAAGYHVTTDETTPADLDAELEIAIRGWAGDPVPASIRLRQGGTIVEGIDVTYSQVAPDPAETSRRAAILLVNAMLASPRLGALAARLHGGLDPAKAVAADNPKSAAEAPADRAFRELDRETAKATSTASATPTPAVFVGASPQPTAYALVIGIDQYRDALPIATGAADDARHFADMARRTLGVPESHLRLAVGDRASKVDIQKHLAWLKASVPQNGRVYVYFSGHGAPEPARGTSYLVPYDGDPQYLAETALPLDELTRALRETKAKETVVFLDACFSGTGPRSILAAGVRPLITVRAPAPTSHVVVFSASSGAQISGPGAGSVGGVFTKFLIDGLGGAAADADGDGSISLAELSDWVRPRVAREAKKENRDQTPSLTLAPDLQAATLIVAWGLPPR